MMMTNAASLVFMVLQRDKIKENKEKIKLNKQLPWLVGNVVEVRIRLRRCGVVIAANITHAALSE